MPFSPRLHWPAYSPEATLPKTGLAVCPDGESSDSVLRGAILRLDRALRKSQGIYEFCQDDHCLLRIAITEAKKEVALPDGRAVRAGDSVVELHWWNEHVALLLAGRPTLARAKVLAALVQNSFKLLGEYVATAPEARKARFIHAHAVLPVRNRRSELARVARRYGFCAIRQPSGGVGRVHDFFEDYLVHALQWAFHPGAPAKRARTMKRVDLWTGRAEFMARFGPASLPMGARRATAKAERSKLEEVAAADSDVDERRLLA
jgi:YkoP domain